MVCQNVAVGTDNEAGTERVLDCFLLASFLRLAVWLTEEPSKKRIIGERELLGQP
jgi:hypothetical protein